MLHMYSRWFQLVVPNVVKDDAFDCICISANMFLFFVFFTCLLTDEKTKSTRIHIC